ncbi:MAG: hypothetical protein PHN56_01955 [Candidatus Nanoarchaeia archaeon]|nr:hypothetical protein [Candidatus Nanoarchaeia archaeon]
MKAITPVISVILLIMLTIATSAAAFFFINSTVTDLQSEGGTETFPGSDNSRLNLVSVTGSKAIVRNDGTTPVTEVVMFINGELLNYVLNNPIQPGELREINYTAREAGEDLEIKIIYNSGKITQVTSPASKNTENSGFTEIAAPLNPVEIKYSGCPSSSVVVNFDDNILFGDDDNLACGCDSEITLVENLNSGFEAGETYWEFGASSITSSYHSEGSNSLNVSVNGQGLMSLVNKNFDYLIKKVNFDYNISSISSDGYVVMVNIEYKNITAGARMLYFLSAGDWIQNADLGEGPMGPICGEIIGGSYVNCTYLSDSFDTWNHLSLDNIYNDFETNFGEFDFSLFTNSSVAFMVQTPSLESGIGEGYFDNVIMYYNTNPDNHICDLENNKLGDGICVSQSCSATNINDLRNDFCAYNNHTWFNGTVSGSNSPCCGDDLTSDTFSNDTAFCCESNEFYDCTNVAGYEKLCRCSGATIIDTCGDNVCSAWEGIANCSYDCLPHVVTNNAVITEFSDRLEGYCNASSPNINDVLQYNYSWIKNSNTIISNIEYKMNSIVTSYFHSCAILQNGSAMCWGNNDNNYLGNGSTGGSSSIPVFVAGNYLFKEISTKGSHTCGILINGSAVCWGWNAYGQLGIGTQINANQPAFVTGDYNFSQISAGSSSTCGVLVNGSAVCWGVGGYGRLGNNYTYGPTEYQLVPVFVTGDYKFKKVSILENHACGLLVNSSLMCWGRNRYGELGNGVGGDGYDSLVPVFVIGNYNFKEIAVDRYGSCGLLLNESLACWGTILNLGELSSIPRPLFTNYTFKSFSNGLDHWCGILSNGSSVCYGLDTYGQLGTGGWTSGGSEPYFVYRNYTFADINAGGYETCGITLNGSAMCWGSDGSGELGNGLSGYNSNMPQYVIGDYQFINNSYYWNKDTLISILPNSFYTAGDTLTFTCNVKNAFLPSNEESESLEI